ncbi:MAG: hypothetical protein MJ249_10295 [Kiritimatiellae bacterium]|nr:hypothetical protein [Kiritimatiellia bacterium]
MWQYINSVTAAGWGRLLTALVPTTWQLVVADLLLFVILPLTVVFVLVAWHRARFSPGTIGVWRAAGAAWSVCFWLSMVAMIAIYLLSAKVLQTSVSGLPSFERQYRVYLSDGVGAADEIKDVVVQLRNPDVPETAVLYIAPEYKVVHFFWENYRFIHPILWTLLDLIALAWFFFPGFKMKSQKIKL